MGFQSNGINMLNMKRNNRKEILRLIYQSGAISRKEIAEVLGLTPSAITGIISELMSERLVVENNRQVVQQKKGRKQILLSINHNDFLVLGVYMSTNYFSIVALTLDGTTVFSNNVTIADCGHQSSAILDKLEWVIRTRILENPQYNEMKIIGLGVSIPGIVDSKKGISVDSYGLCEKKAAIVQPLEEALGLPVIVANNICALSHGESFSQQQGAPENAIFVKYGPGVGAVMLGAGTNGDVLEFEQVEIGHMIMDTNGAVCVCGKQGCLETIVRYENIEHAIAAKYSPRNTPILYRLTEGDVQAIDMENIIAAAQQGEHVCAVTFNRVLYYFALALCNVTQLFRTKQLVLYGNLFKNSYVRDALSEYLKQYDILDKVSYTTFSPNNQATGPATMQIALFFENGGSMEK